MILGLLPAFRRSGTKSAIASWIAGIGTFAFTHYAMTPSMTVGIAAPVLASAAVFIAGGWLESAQHSASVAAFFSTLDGDAHDNHK